ncbi:MAG: dTDP-glucose 4,6-dehydratase [Elusimicrobiota bacterium]|nr:dTDP-glucose 4,6-dehydratase [Endomicrobiia bacterium]MDW8166393.1 dTDP-glucose 4,6-dehydratase [Elusimicrobiota bacterium]
MKILVTGGCGFMGSDFVRKAVIAGKEVVVVDKMTYAGDIKRLEEVKGEYKFYKCDIVNFEHLEKIFKKEKPKVVLHYAAETHVDRSILKPSDFVLTNVVGTFNLLEISKKYCVGKFIHISTDEVYGELPKDKNLKFKETSPLRPKSPYAATKAAADNLVSSYVKTYNFPAIIVRASNNYGFWQYPEKLIPLTISYAIFGKKIPIYGKGLNIRTWLFVEDFTKALFLVLKKGKVGEVYNIGSNEEIENIKVVKKILSYLGKDESLIEFIADRPGHDLRYALDITKISSELGWKAETKFEEGVKKTVNWYINNLEWLKEKIKIVDSFVKKLKYNYSKI